MDARACACVRRCVPVFSHPLSFETHVSACVVDERLCIFSFPTRARTGNGIKFVMMRENFLRIVNRGGLRAI